MFRKSVLASGGGGTQVHTGTFTANSSTFTEVNCGFVPDKVQFFKYPADIQVSVQYDSALGTYYNEQRSINSTGQGSNETTTITGSTNFQLTANGFKYKTVYSSYDGAMYYIATKG